jgi:hypothetical protein
MALVHTDYRAVWEQILPGVRRALEHQCEGLRPEDVYCALKTQQAFLFTCDEGFLVLRETPNDNTGLRDLLIWIAHMDGEGSMIKKYASEVDEIAKKANLSGIQIASMRPGYERALPEGWQRLYTRWRKAL